ncbi:hypothetical protein OAE80_01325 [Planctomycetaceae bacterium]|nr:hypothetical protein [Planctomycetaceae bacterium]
MIRKIIFLTQRRRDTKNREELHSVIGWHSTACPPVGEFVSRGDAEKKEVINAHQMALF